MPNGERLTTPKILHWHNSIDLTTDHSIHSDKESDNEANKTHGSDTEREKGKKFFLLEEADSFDAINELI